MSKWRLVGLKGHVKYAWYIIRHKWYVFVECCKLGIPFRGILHDWHKFLPSEWWPYAVHFYGDKVLKSSYEMGVASAYCGIFEAVPFGKLPDDWFDLAWWKHQRRSSHHWQVFILREDSGATKCMPMSMGCRKEMLADWRGAGKAILGSKANTKDWYLKNREKITLNGETRKWIEDRLEVKASDII